jgi:hypothetical protein
MSLELHALSYEYGTKVELRAADYWLRDRRHKIAPAPADDCMVQHLDCSMIVWCRPASYIDSTLLAHYQSSALADDSVGTTIISYYLEPLKEQFLNQSHGEIIHRKK